MKTKRILAFSLLVLFLNSCMIRSLAALTSSNLKEKPVKEVVIDFEDVYGLMVVPVVIEGKTYRFIFDTGAGSTVISKEISELKSFKKTRRTKRTRSKPTHLLKKLSPSLQ